MALAAYLVAAQGYAPEQITLLTTYVGQLLLITDLLRRRGGAALLKGVLVKTVDNYQGEENDIVILSLVRSNEGGRRSAQRAAHSQPASQPAIRTWRSPAPRPALGSPARGFDLAEALSRVWWIW